MKHIAGLSDSTVEVLQKMGNVRRARTPGQRKRGKVLRQLREVAAKEDDGMGGAVLPSFSETKAPRFEFFQARSARRQSASARARPHG